MWLLMSLVKGVLQFHSSINGIMSLSHARRKIQCERDDEDGSWREGMSRTAVRHVHTHTHPHTLVRTSSLTSVTCKHSTPDSGCDSVSC